MIFPPDDPAAPPRARVKICGLTHPDDAALAIALGADALGLNFYPGSPRCLDPARDAGWLRALPAGVRRVAVVVNASREALRRLLGEGLVDSAQLHGDEDEAFCAALAADGVPFAKAIRVRDADSLRGAARFGAADLVLDAFRPDAYGGTGRTLDWTLAAAFVREERPPARRTILSGGLTPDNVAEAIRRVRPYGVDVASGVEAGGDPRRKDPARLRGVLRGGPGGGPPRVNGSQKGNFDAAHRGRNGFWMSLTGKSRRKTRFTQRNRSKLARLLLWQGFAHHSSP